MVCSWIALLDLGLHGHKTAGEKAKPNLSLLTMWNVVSPYSHLKLSGKPTVREALGDVGKERRKKQKPLHNGDG